MHELKHIHTGCSGSMQRCPICSMSPQAMAEHGRPLQAPAGRCRPHRPRQALAQQRYACNALCNACVMHYVMHYVMQSSMHEAVAGPGRPQRPWQAAAGRGRPRQAVAGRSPAGRALSVYVKLAS